MLAVTTRNKLRSRRFSPNMVMAWLSVRKQLYQTPGILRYITGIASLTEFYTLTLWENQEHMFRFVSSGSHRRLMWMFSRWSSSFWSMRWLPAQEELGDWNGLRLAEISSEQRGLQRPAPAAAQLRQQLAQVLGGYIDISGRMDQRNPDPGASGVSAVALRAPIRSPAGARALRRSAHAWRERPGLLRCIHGIGPGESLVLALWRHGYEDAARAFMLQLNERATASWALLLTAGDYEVGHWDGLRLRQLAAARARESDDAATIDEMAPLP